MTLFSLGCIALVLFSGLFYLNPTLFRRNNEETITDLNLDWFRQREKELRAAGDIELMGDAQQRLLEDLSDEGTQTSRTESEGSDRAPFRTWLILPVVAVASSALYFVLGAAPDVAISRQLESMDAQATPQQMATVISAIEKRARQRPANLHYRSLLGRYYMGQEDYSRAAELYNALVLDVPNDAQVLALAAQASYLANERILSDVGRAQAEQALTIAPRQRTALGLLGMASFEQGQYRAAINYWQRLLALEPVGSESAQMITGIIERAQQQIGDQAPNSVKIPSNVQHHGVTVRVRLPTGSSVAANDTVFVLAREADSDSRMPIAVKRFTGSQLPIDVRLDDTASMAGQKLSQAKSVVVIVQVSPDGKPGEGNASWLGNGGPVAPSLDTVPLEIVLRPAVQGE